MLREQRRGKRRGLPRPQPHSAGTTKGTERHLVNAVTLILLRVPLCPLWLSVTRGPSHEFEDCTMNTSLTHSAEAGHWGREIRSDLHVSVEPRESGGLEVGLESRVAPYYGDAILAQTRHVLESLGVKNARVAIHDEGALPFVISARIETAVHRAGLGVGPESFAAENCVIARGRRRKIVCAVRGFTFPAASRNISSTRACMAPTRSFSISKIRCILPKKMPPAFWCATRFAQWNSARASAWCASTSCRWVSKISLKSFPKRPT